MKYLDLYHFLCQIRFSLKTNFSTINAINNQNNRCADVNCTNIWNSLINILHYHIQSRNMTVQTKNLMLLVTDGQCAIFSHNRTINVMSNVFFLFTINHLKYTSSKSTLVTPIYLNRAIISSDFTKNIFNIFMDWRVYLVNLFWLKLDSMLDGMWHCWRLTVFWTQWENHTFHQNSTTIRILYTHNTTNCMK